MVLSGASLGDFLLSYIQMKVKKIKTLGKAYPVIDITYIEKGSYPQGYPSYEFLNRGRITYREWTLEGPKMKGESGFYRREYLFAFQDL